MIPPPSQDQDVKSSPKAYSVPGINADSYGNYEFWRWEYQRRNPDYREAFGQIVKFLKQYNVDSEEARDKFSLLSFKLMFNAAEGKYDKNIDQNMLEFICCADYLSAKFANKFNRKVKDCDNGHSATTLIRNAVNNNVEFFVLFSDYHIPKLETSLEKDGDELILRFPKDINVAQLTAEAAYQVLAWRECKEDDEFFFSLAKNIDKVAGDAKQSARRANGNLARSIGVYLYEYKFQNTDTDTQTIKNFIDSPPKEIHSVTHHKSLDDESWLRKCLKKTIFCIEKMEVLPFE